MKFDIQGGSCGHSCCLRVENLSVRIGTDSILKDMNLHVHCGEMVALVREHQLPAVFTEISGSASAAGIIAAETGSKVYSLDMAMAGQDYFEAMYHNINTIKEALG